MQDRLARLRIVRRLQDHRGLTEGACHVPETSERSTIFFRQRPMTKCAPRPFNLFASSSGFTRPSKANQIAFNSAVEKVAEAAPSCWLLWSQILLPVTGALRLSRPSRRAAQRFGLADRDRSTAIARDNAELVRDPLTGNRARVQGRSQCAQTQSWLDEWAPFHGRLLLSRQNRLVSPVPVKNWHQPYGSIRPFTSWHWSGNRKRMQISQR